MRSEICRLGDKVRLVGSSNSFILQEINKDNKWEDKLYWYSIRDIITGYLNYMAKRTKIGLDKEGITALVELLNRMDQRSEKLIKELNDLHIKDPISEEVDEPI